MISFRNNSHPQICLHTHLCLFLWTFSPQKPERLHQWCHCCHGNPWAGIVFPPQHQNPPFLFHLTLLISCMFFSCSLTTSLLLPPMIELAHRKAKTHKNTHTHTQAATPPSFCAASCGARFHKRPRFIDASFSCTHLLFWEARKQQTSKGTPVKWEKPLRMSTLAHCTFNDVEAAKVEDKILHFFSQFVVHVSISCESFRGPYGCDASVNIFKSCDTAFCRYWNKTKVYPHHILTIMDQKHKQTCHIVLVLCLWYRDPLH